MMAQIYERPQTLDAALGLLSGGSWDILAGGTDIYPASAAAFAWGGPAPERILDISAIEELNSIEETQDAYRVGSQVTWTRMIEADLPAYFNCLQQAGREVGGRQIQNRGTLVGNICNASPAADGVPALLALDAAVEIKAATGCRTLPLSEYILGNRETAHGAAEMVTAIVVPKHKEHAQSTFLKLGARRYLVVSIAMVAALIETDEANHITCARIAVGACSAVAQRLSVLESALIGRSLDELTNELVTDDMLSPLMPIDDVRGSAAYRRSAALVLIQRALGILSPSERVAS